MSYNYFKTPNLGSSPWGTIQHIEKITRGVAFVSTAGHGGARVAKGTLSKFAVDAELITKLGGSVSGGYVYFEEDCAISLFLFDCPEILKLVAEKRGIDAEEYFQNCRESAQRWFPQYFTAE